MLYSHPHNAIRRKSKVINQRSNKTIEKEVNPIMNNEIKKRIS
jgi:hypothetical protein